MKTDTGEKLKSGKKVDDGRTDQAERKARVILDLNVVTPHQANQSFFKESQFYGHKGINNIMNRTARDLRISGQLELAETT